MSSNDQQIMNELESLLIIGNENDKLELEAELLHLKFVGVIEDMMEQEGLSKADLAAKLSTSKSYITQLFTGDKLLNIKTLVKLQGALNFSFRIEAERKRPVFEAVICDKFKKRFGLDSVKAGVEGTKYQLGKTPNKFVA
ncbi:MAG TPA: helix-turn-helix transcriptional regulator [Prolixibacteraceae bacterium]|nr:helix-turn-helix transcriptional regulator [Prolixibacteraceae bacterium]